MTDSGRRSRATLVGLIALAVALAGTACGSGSIATVSPTGTAVPTPFVPAGADAHTTATTFDLFPVLWLGDGYDSNGDGVPDMPLKFADWKHADPIYVNGQLEMPAISQFGLAYGTCQPPPGRDECTAPISITLDAPGAFPLSDAAKTGRTVEIRRATFIVYGEGDLYLHTAAFDITISAPGRTAQEAVNRAIGVAQQLVGANAKAANITRLTDFEGNPLVPPEGSTPAPPSPTTTPPTPPTPGPTVAAPLPIATAYYPAVTPTPEPAATTIAVLPTSEAAP